MYYWYGENKEFTTLGSNVWTWGIRAYRSRDFYNWDDLGLIIPPDTLNAMSPLHFSQTLDRPHMLYNKVGINADIVAASKGRKVLYVTERAVFELKKDGMHLIEIAPGVDLQTQVLDQIDFKPIIEDVKLMDERIFLDEPMGLVVAD